MIGRVVIVNDFSVARGGATALALLSAQLLRGRGIPVTYVAGDDGSNPMLSEMGAAFVSLGGQSITPTNRLAGSIQGIYNRAARDRLAQHIRDHDSPDTIYHLHGWAHVLSPQILSALKPVASRTIIHAHDFFLVCPNGGQFHYPKATPCSLKPLGAGCLTTNCDKRTYADKIWRSTRQAVLRYIMDFDPGFPRILLIHDKMADYFIRAGIALDRLKTISNPVNPFTKSRVPVENNRYAYFLGRLVPEKGILDALEAAIIANVPLKVIGEGPLRNELTAKYPQVKFLGWRSSGEIADIINDARVVLMPTHYPEPFGLVAMEAVQSGIPVIVAETAFIAENIVKNGVGFSCDPKDHTRFAAFLRQIIDMAPSEIKAMSLNAIAYSNSVSLSPEQWGLALLTCYEETLSDKSSQAA